MKAPMSVVAVLLAGTCLVPGCSDAEGKITMASIQEFWAGLDRRCREDLRRLGLVPPPQPSLWGPAGRPKVDGPPFGTLFASRQEGLVVVEVNLANVPKEAKTVATGLKLRDGVVVQPEAIHFVRETVHHDQTVPRVDFDFGRPPAPGGSRGESGLFLRVAYGLDRKVSVDGGTFTLVLGEAQCGAACSMGITAAMSIEDGGPTLIQCLVLPPGETGGGPPAPPAPEAGAPTVSFRFREHAKGAGGPIVWITPAVASVYPQGPPRKMLTARADVPEEAP